MTDILSLTGPQILAIPELEPERLFGKPDQIHDRFKMLAKRWHPDNALNGDAEVFKHILALRTRADDLVKTGSWHVPGELQFSASGKEYRLRYFKSFDFELGRAYMSEHYIAYVLRKEFADLASNAVSVINGLSFPDDETRTVMMRYLPVVKGHYETADSSVLMIEKPADLIRMRDLLDHCGSKIDPKHVAWMVSRMLNHSSYLEWAKLSHNDLSLDSLFVCPEHHTVCILGGWWFAKSFDERLSALPQRTVNNAPNEVINTKKASASTDPELVRLTGRELLGNANGIHLVKDKSLPEPMVSWLRVSGQGSALKDYAYWRDHVLTQSFGPRKFVKMPISAKDVYPT